MFSWFKKMLRYNYFQKDREIRIAELENQIKAYVLEKDEVAPPIEALNSFKGGFRNINVDVEIMDYPLYGSISFNKEKCNSNFCCF